MSKKRPTKIGLVKKSGQVGSQTVTSTTARASSAASPSNSTPPSALTEASNLSNIIDQSKAKLAEVKEPRNKGGRPAGTKIDPVTGRLIRPQIAGNGPSSIIQTLQPTPGPGAPMIAEAYGVATIMVASWCNRDFKLEVDEKKTLGDQADVLIQWYLPDLLKDPKRALLYTHLFTIACIGIRMLQTPPHKKSTMGNSQNNSSNSGASKDSEPPVNKVSEDSFKEPQPTGPIAPTSDPAAYYNRLNGSV